MTALDVARAQLRYYQEELKRHSKGCLACTRARTDPYTEPCATGSELDIYAGHMTRQIELLTPPPQPEYVQEGLW